MGGRGWGGAKEREEVWWPGVGEERVGLKWRGGAEGEGLKSKGWGQREG